MPCDKLAVQTATLAENFTALMLDDATVEILRQALANTIGVSVTRIAARNHVIFEAGSSKIYIGRTGEVQVMSRYLNQAAVDDLLEKIKPLIGFAAQRATQNVVLAAMQRAGVKVNAETTAPNGARVVQFSLF